MPAQSQQQQKLFGLALAFKRGEVPASEVSDEIKDIADRMSEKEIEDFAATKHKGLPKMKEQLRKIVREIMRERAISELELSKDDMDKLHSDGEVEVDGEKVTFEEGKKRFRQQDGIGKAKYTISYHDGKQKHKDGSDFFGIQIFKNKKDLETFRNALLKKGYIEESVNEANTIGKMAKRYKNKDKFISAFFAHMKKTYGPTFKDFEKDKKYRDNIAKIWDDEHDVKESVNEQPVTVHNRTSNGNIVTTLKESDLNEEEMKLYEFGKKVTKLMEKNCPTDAGKWAASKAAAKKKFDVYPSAYANGWAAKNYKGKGGGWRKCKG